ncbi:MAG: hypothetical protein HQK83_07500 [Fibrobacteria bacterium]|nr:hypothetical protein [Fibrobacteria bacterium]
MTNRIFYAALIVLACAAGVFAQLNVTGKVINTFDQPLENVTVSIASESASDLTGADGLFDLNDGTAIKSGLNSSLKSDISYKNGILNLAVYEKTLIELSLYDLQGKVIKKFPSQLLTAGSHKRTIFSDAQAYGLYFLKGTVGSSQVNMQVLHFAGAQNAIHKQSTPSLSKSAAGENVIVFTKEGYQELRITLDNLTKDMQEIVLLTTDEGAEQGIKLVKAFENELRFRLNLDPDKQYQLLELWQFQEYNKNDSYHVMWEGNADHQTLARFDGTRDAMFNKYQLIEKDTRNPIGGCHYTTEFGLASSQDFPLHLDTTIKKGISIVHDIDDVIALGAKHIHENIVLSTLVRTSGGDTKYYIDINGERVFFSESKVESLDRDFKRYSDAGISVFVVLLNWVGKNSNSPLKHPDFTIPDTTLPGFWSAFNTTSGEGIKYYRATIEFLAQRYTRQDKQYGQIYSIIIGNELTAHFAWYNIGYQTKDKFLVQYHNALRIADVAVRKYHKQLKIHVSYTYHWALTWHSPTFGISGIDLTQGLHNMAIAGGNFPWSLAIHPYPVSLFVPSWWRDPDPVRELDTPLMTMKNIEVLPEFLRRKDITYKGKIRPIDITEMGFHSIDESEGKEKLQAAAWTCAYLKVKRMPEIGVYIYHSHYSSHEESGLNMGLWTWDEPARKKYIYDVYKATETDNWEAAFEFAKPILGIDNWDEGTCVPNYEGITD